ncbi:hypothetical protein J2046_002080 [Rhizobium petrolearium]|nr:hypothetical protein [Neorhizobium petrolearium]MBP1843824.1 hypothetical protein [Neorhizobium petrolearium]
MQETACLQPIAEIIDIFDKRQKENGIFFLSPFPSAFRKEKPGLEARS